MVWNPVHEIGTVGHYCNAAWFKVAEDDMTFKLAIF